MSYDADVLLHDAEPFHKLLLLGEEDADEDPLHLSVFRQGRLLGADVDRRAEVDHDPVGEKLVGKNRLTASRLKWVSCIFKLRISKRSSVESVTSKRNDIDIPHETYLWVIKMNRLTMSDFSV